MKKDDYIQSLPGKLPEEELNKIEDFFLKDLSLGAQAKPSGNIKNYVFIHKDLKWGILKTDGKYGLENTESYSLVKLSKSPRFLGMKMGIATAWSIIDTLFSGDRRQDSASLSGITSISFLTDSEKEFFAALGNFS